MAFRKGLWAQGAGIIASLFLLGCPPNEVVEEVPENTAAKCSDSQDNDGDGAIDCGDIECANFANCFCLTNPTDPSCVSQNLEVCDNGGPENDGDNLIDCNDPDCTDGDPNNNQGSECVPENCANTNGQGQPLDDDGDGLANCQDPGCSGSPQCVGQSGGEGNGPRANCLDGLDNDNDGFIDCGNPQIGTAGDSECNEECNGAGTAENCFNGADDNADGLTDCSDPQCQGQAGCGGAGTENCFNGIDDDNNGLADCSDFGCFSDPLCGGGGGGVPGLFENCGNGVDDNGDGLADCDDFFCQTDPASGCLPSTGDCSLDECTNLDDPATFFNCIFFDSCCTDIFNPACF